ncbi:MAG: hypothetical protein AABY07_05260 [Nanoarchaeota archaeon]
MFIIIKTQEYLKDFNKLDKSDQLRVIKIINQLKERGDEIGKPLSGLPYFREKKFNGKRLLFLIYKDLNTILIPAITDKKLQQTTINNTLINLLEYNQYVIDIVKKQP